MKVKELQKKAKEADSAGKKLTEPFPTIKPTSEAAKEYRQSFQETLGGVIFNQGKKQAVQGPFITGNAYQLETLSRSNKHMDLTTAEQTKLFATVLNCLADRELAFLELEKQTKDSK